MNAPKSLNPRQLAFVQELLRGKSLTTAYRNAGYTSQGPAAHTGASKLLQRPAIAALVRTGQENATRQTIMDRREIIDRLTRVLRSEATDLEDNNHQHQPRHGGEDPALALPIHHVTRRTVVKPDGTQSVHTITRSLSKHAAIQQLGQLLNLPQSVTDPAALTARAHARETGRIQLHAVLSHITPHHATTPPAASSSSLNIRQRLFCENLSRGLTLADSFRKAGYEPQLDPSHSVDRLLARPAVRQYLTELLTFLTLCGRATAAQLTHEARFINQIIRHEIEDPEGLLTTRTSLHSISPPRAMAQLTSFLPPIHYHPRPGP